ncbi:MAG: helix-turn-helix transcriptional regulator [Sphingomonas sp.]|nr:helix-turn-helix transcriptional regulator [Sphingomonas sp.]
MATGESSRIYADLMRLKPEGMSPNGWAIKAGVSRTVWADMRRHGNPSRRTLERLLIAAGSSLAEFEALRIAPMGADAESRSTLGDRRGPPWGAAQLPPLALVATAIGADWGDPASRIELIELRTGELVDRVPRPASLANDHSAYAITVVGDSMWPRFRPGRRVAVSPKAAVALGDDVLVKLKVRSGNDPGSAVVPALIKELVRRTGSGLELKQFNPAITFEVPEAEIATIEKVVGELI